MEFNAAKGLMEKMMQRFDAMGAKLGVIDLNKSVKALKDNQKDSAEKLSKACELIKLETKRRRIDNEGKVTSLDTADSEVTSAFDTMFRKHHVPHLLEKIFFSLDYDSFMACHKVNKDWNKLLSSDRYQRESEKMHFEKKNNEKKLCYHSANGNVEEVRYLLSRGVNPNCEQQHPDLGLGTPTSLASSSGFTDVVKLLLHAGGDPNANIEMPAGKGSCIRHMLIAATLKGHKDVVKLLLSKGAWPNVADEQGATPLCYAIVHHSNTDIPQILIDGGADPNQASELGTTPLHCAVRKGKSVMKILIDAGADVNMASKYGTTPLHLVTEKQTVRMLLNAGAEVNRPDTHGDTALHYAAGSGRRYVVQALIDSGADPNRANHEGETPLNQARRGGRNGYSGVIKILEGLTRRNI